jgi:large subunit ribosomal protein L4
VFGPKPRRYAYSIPKKQYRAALHSVLSAKFASGDIVIVSELSLPEPKTRVLAKMLAQMGVAGKTLIVTGQDRSNLERAARNLADVTVLTPDELNVYDVIRCRSIIIPERELPRVQEAWA